MGSEMCIRDRPCTASPSWSFSTSTSLRMLRQICVRCGSRIHHQSSIANGACDHGDAVAESREALAVSEKDAASFWPARFASPTESSSSSSFLHCTRRWSFRRFRSSRHDCSCSACSGVIMDVSLVDGLCLVAVCLRSMMETRARFLGGCVSCCTRCLCRFSFVVRSLSSTTTYRAAFSLAS